MGVKCVLAGALGAVLSHGDVTSASLRPNIVVMLADNLGYGDLGAYGGGAVRGMPTPRIDKLARDGLRLTNLSQSAHRLRRHF